MKRLSLKIRVFSAALLALLLFIPLAAYALERAYVASLTQAVLERMRVQTLTLISEFEVLNAISNMPDVIINGQFNIPDSGVYGVISARNLIVWRSQSTMNWVVPNFQGVPDIGKEKFTEVDHNAKRYFVHSYTAEFSSSRGFLAYTFHVYQDKSSFDAEVIHYRHTLWYWLGNVSVLLLGLLIFTLFTALRPINRLVKDISNIEKGENERLTSHYPPELEPLKSSLNHLLSTEENQRQRYKNSLGDLAHSLKTPLAVLSGLPDLPEAGKEPVEQINNIIQRQLKRAVAGTGSRWNQKANVKAVVDKLVSAMEKVYRQKELSFFVDIPASLGFYGDETDLLELLGNLVDNACKAAETEVLIRASQSKMRLHISVADDGPGIPPDERQALIERGHRLDSYKSGQGIGMAVVADLVSAYEGHLNIDNGTEEQGLPTGAVITVDFPCHPGK
ncbi:ATP-binding protein [Alteromonas sp. a30]|uniref:ATP-binding protein n=1 Tax=Alteromonas sp. a30 TaxID=2730917 RepID=UPI00227EDADE|nr:ATP-binding protein [Alteromonas sp. a30]MCY7295170.1 GHKL domain-containing protein [Alteromonas sp. a30]